MQEYIIDVSKIEDLQTTNNTTELDKIFNRAKSTIVNGEQVILVRKNDKGSADRFDQFSTLDDPADSSCPEYKWILLSEPVALSFGAGEVSRGSGRKLTQSRG